MYSFFSALIKIIAKEDSCAQRIRSAQAGLGGKRSVAHRSLSPSACSAQEEMSLCHSTNEAPLTMEGPEKAHHSISIHKESLSSIRVWNCGSCRMEVPRLGQPWGWWLHRAQHGDACMFSGIDPGSLSLVHHCPHTCGMYMTLATMVIRLHF